MKSYAKLNGQPDLKLKIAILMYQRYIPSFVFYQQAQRVLKTNLW